MSWTGVTLTMTPDLRLEVSRRINDEFESGRDQDHYALRGKEVSVPRP